MTRTARRRQAAVVVAAAAAVVAERLEGRQLFAATLAAPIPDATGVAGSQQTVDLQPFFNDPKYGVVRMTTPLGTVDIKTLDEEVPLNAANFLAYVNAGRYDGAIFHRSIPGFVLQGGSEYADGSAVPAFAPVVDEPSPLSNVRGTLAFARLPPFQDINGNGVQDNGEPTIPGGGPDSATNGFFFNLADNASNLDNQNGGFAVFGQVLGDGMTVVDQLTTAAASNPASVPMTSMRVVDDVTYSVTSSDPAVVNPSIVNGDLVLAYGSGGGTATVTVTATDLDGATTAQDAFDVTSTFGVIVGTGGSKSATFTEADGTQVTVSVKGPGTASLSFGGSGLTQSTAKGKTTVTGTDVSLAGVAVTGTTAATTITISSKGGTDRQSTLGGLTTDGAVRAISAKGSVLTGALTAGGAVGSVVLAGATGGTITLGGAATDKGSSLSLGTLADTAVTSAGAVRSAKLATATATAEPADFTAPSIASLSSSGDLALDVVVTGGGNLGKLSVGGVLTGDLSAHQIASISAKGGITGSTITASHGAAEAAGNPDAKGDQGIQSIKTGAMSGVVVNSAGTIGSISAASITGGRIVAGATSLTTLPTTLAELVEPAAVLSLKTKAIAGAVVAAQRLGKLSVGTLTTVNAGTPFGFAADSITSLSGVTDGGQKFSIKKATD
ncbi:MAG TPA: peptidylprolyl isomerase, partial [Humisphaera sp.]